MPAKDLFDQRFDLILLHPGPHGLHRFAMSFGGDVGRGLHDLDLILALQHAHLVNDRRRIDDRLRRMNRLAIRSAHPRDLFDDRVVEIAIHAEPVIEHVSTVEKLRQLRLKLCDRKRLVRAKLALRAFNTRATPSQISRSDLSAAQTTCVLFSSFRLDYRERIRFKAGQVEKVGVWRKR